MHVFNAQSAVQDVLKEMYPTDGQLIVTIDEAWPMKNVPAANCCTRNEIPVLQLYARAPQPGVHC